mgnify:CR=1 FL=1
MKFSELTITLAAVGMLLAPAVAQQPLDLEPEPEPGQGANLLDGASGEMSGVELDPLADEQAPEAPTLPEPGVDGRSASDGPAPGAPSQTISQPSESDGDFELAEPAPIAPPEDVMIEPGAQTGMGVESMESFDGSEPLGPASNGATVVDFQGEELPQVLRLLARQARINLYVSDQVAGTITLRVQDKTPMETLRFIVQAKGLVLDEIEGDYFVKTQAEKASEPTESAHYTFSYAPAEDAAQLLASQLNSGAPVQVDKRTNTVYYQEVVSNLDQIQMFLETLDKPTKQVMIEARLVEVNANPKQSYGINWSGVLGSSSSPQTFRYGGSTFPDPEEGTYEIEFDEGGRLQLLDFARLGENDPRFAIPGGIGQAVSPDRLFEAVGGQFAILSVPQMSLTMRLLNEDADAEFLAQPRIVTADNQEATIKITRNQPVPQLNFNEQTATAVFGGFEDKEFGNTLIVKPAINEDDFITLNVKPEVSNKVGDATFTFAGATVASPIIDTRSLESNILIKSGNTLAIGGLLQDEQQKESAKVPILGDIPVLGYLFTERLNSRTKRNLLVFVTPNILEHGQGTGLEDQVDGLHDSGEEYADPNGWRNNAKGAIRLVPTSNAQRAGDYPKPGTPLRPGSVSYKANAVGRE